MRLLLLAPLFLLPAAAEPVPTRVIDPSASAPAHCPPISRYHAARRGGGLKPDKLTDLPGADHYKAAYRRINGCVAPIIANFKVGGR